MDNDDSTQEADAFENAWRSREHYHESRDGVHEQPLPAIQAKAEAAALIPAVPFFELLPIIALAQRIV